MEINKIIEKIETLYPLDTQEKWDNSGWQIKLPENHTQNVLLALSPTSNIIEQAKKFNCNLIITHHPLFLNGIRQLNTNNYEENVAIQLIQNNIQLYSTHTLLDKGKNGTNDTLCQILDIKPIKTIENLAKIGEIEEISIENLIEKVKNLLKIEKIKITNPKNIITVKTVGICAGSGCDYLDKMTEADVFLTGDLKYHPAISSPVCILDIGHFESERIILPVLKQLIGENAIIAQENTPWQFA